MSEENNRGSQPAPIGDSPFLRSVVPLRGDGQRLIQTPPPNMSKLLPLKASPGQSAAPLFINEARPSWGVKKEWSATWVVRAEDLEPVPSDFPLEKTHREIYEDVAVVSARISDSLRALSIESTYCSESVKVSCKTEDCVKFKIRLFAGGDGCQPIVVEVQKRSGPSFCFMRSCRALLSAAEGKAQETCGQLRGPKTFPKPLCQMKCLRGVLKDPNDDEREEHLSTVKRLFNSERLDQHSLALENLLCLTDPIKTSPLVSLNVSKAVLTDEETRNRVVLNSNNNSYSEQSLHLSLCVLGNACVLCSSKGCLSEMVEADSWFANALVPLLLTILSQARNHTNSAYQATRSLLPLLVCGNKGLLSTPANAKEILTSANALGARFHELLQIESQRCLDQLEDS